MTTAAWAMLGVTWSVILFFTGPLLLEGPREPDAAGSGRGPGHPLQGRLGRPLPPRELPQRGEALAVPAGPPRPSGSRGSSGRRRRRARSSGSRSPSRRSAPWPIRSWRSTRQPRSFFESFAWIDLDEAEAARGVEGVERLAPAVLRDDVVAGGVDVAGVEAEGEARAAVGAGEDRARGARSRGRGRRPGRRPSRGGPVVAEAGVFAAASSRPRAIRSRPASSPSPPCEPGWRTRYGIPFASHRSISSTSASTERVRTTGSGEARLMR